MGTVHGAWLPLSTHVDGLQWMPTALHALLPILTALPGCWIQNRWAPAALVTGCLHFPPVRQGGGLRQLV